MNIKLIIAGILFVVITTGYLYIQVLQCKLEVAAEVQQRLEGVVEQQQKTLERNTEDMKKMKDINGDLSNQFADSQQRISELNTKFNKFNLAEEANKKPSETEIKVNRGTVDALRCNELVTGSGLTDGEKSGKVRNSICDGYVKRLIAKEPKNDK